MKTSHEHDGVVVSTERLYLSFIFMLLSYIQHLKEVASGATFEQVSAKSFLVLLLIGESLVQMELSI